MHNAQKQHTMQTTTPITVELLFIMFCLVYFDQIVLSLCLVISLPAAEILTISTIFFAVGLDGLDLSPNGSRRFSAFAVNLNNRCGNHKNRASATRYAKSGAKVLLLYKCYVL